MERTKPTIYGYENDLNLEETELRLGLPGRESRDEVSSSSSCKSNKRSSSEMDNSNSSEKYDHTPESKAQVVGWPPVRSDRKNALQLVKVSMDGAPYLRKIDLKGYKSYPELLKALEKMFKCSFGAYSEREGYDGSVYAPTYEDKDGDWMLLGDVPWDLFITCCTRLRIIKGSEAK